MDVHEYSDGLSDDQRDPHHRVAVVTSQEAAHEQGKWNLKPATAAIKNATVRMVSEFTGNIRVLH